jgi:predicted nucleic acid-binding Zn ribbon protein
VVICKNCNKEFEPKSKKQIFCRNYCRLASHRKGKERTVKVDLQATCTVCGATYKPDRASSMYCSDACKQTAYRKRKAKPFLLEYFRSPLEECPEDHGPYLASAAYHNGAGFDKWIEFMLEEPEIREKVKIVKCTKYERLDRQELYLKEHEADGRSFMVLSGGYKLVCLPMVIGDSMMLAIQTEIILEQVRGKPSDRARF